MTSADNAAIQLRFGMRGLAEEDDDGGGGGDVWKRSAELWNVRCVAMLEVELGEQGVDDSRGMRFRSFCAEKEEGEEEDAWVKRLRSCCAAPRAGKADGTRDSR